MVCWVEKRRPMSLGFPKISCFGTENPTSSETPQSQQTRTPVTVVRCVKSLLTSQEEQEFGVAHASSKIIYVWVGCVMLWCFLPSPWKEYKSEQRGPAMGSCHWLTLSCAAAKWGLTKNSLGDPPIQNKVRLHCLLLWLRTKVRISLRRWQP